ncbi:MAG: ferredoxin [Clostridia bacterium]|jgi:ferredoxin|nr:ferredoxin [Clostridia bacterium]NLS86133.1 ferredoxin [Oscillospiraceae bacterium]
MKFFVNDTCVGCGLCANTCPQVFEMTDEGVAKAIDGDVDAAVETEAQEAMEGCPVAAIEEI